MVYAPHRKVTLAGTLGTAPGEFFSFGFAMDESHFTLGQDQVAFEEIRGECIGFFTSPLSYIHPRAVLRQVKIAKIGADGRYVDGPIFDDSLASPGGAGGATLHPFQVSLAVSLVTDRRGPSGKGRFYLPLPVAGVTDAGLVSGDITQDVALRVATFLDAVANRNGADTAQPAVVVASTKGFLSPVRGVRVGRVLDTIRTRRRSLEEQYGAVVPMSN